jgi:hypothetical protein
VSGARDEIDPEFYLSNGRETGDIFGEHTRKILNNWNLRDLLPFGFLFNDLSQECLILP